MWSSSARRFGVAVVASVLALAIVACSSSDGDAAGTDPSTPAAGETEDASTEGSTTSPTVVTGEGGSSPDTSWDPAAAAAGDTGLGSSDAPAMMLVQFGQAWKDANWKSMAAVADEGVVASATDAYVEGAEVSVVGGEDSDLTAGCVDQGDGTAWICELLYGDPTSTAAIFNLTVSNTPDGVRITDLTPGGDAG